MAPEPAQVIEDVEPHGRRLLRIRGELDMASRENVEPAITVAARSGASVILDLSELSFCDSSGISMLFAVHKKAVAAGGALTIRAPLPAVRRVIEITRLDSVIPVTG